MRGAPPGSLASMAQMENERAKNRGQTAKRLIGEFKPYGSSLWLVAALVVLGALSQAAAPWLVGCARSPKIQLPTLCVTAAPLSTAESVSISRPRP